MNVAVLGSGAGGHSAAADWAMAGHAVSIFDFEEFAIQTDGIMRSGGIQLEGELNGFAPIVYAGQDIARVLSGADLILVVGPAYSTEPFGIVCKPYLREGQIVIVCPSSCGGALIFKEAAGLDNNQNRIILAETSTLPYAARLDAPGQVHVFLKLRGGLYVAALPTQMGPKVFEIFESVYPGSELAQNMWQTMLQNNNPIIHPAVTILNAALIERTGGDFYFYEDGVTPAVGRLIQAVDEEKMLIGKELGVQIIPDHELGVMQGYMIDASYENGYRTAPGFMGIRAQKKLDHRYLNEDVGYGLIFYRDLAHALGIQTPVMDAVIKISSIIMKRDYLSEQARTLDSLGLGGLTASQLKKAFESD
jgi:opine dehydrogenase